MAQGTETTSPLNESKSRPWKNRSTAFHKKIACQFTPEQFSEISAFANKRGISFAAAVRRLIFEIGPMKKDPA